MELMKNKNADISSVRSKYELNEDLDEIDDNNQVIVEIVDARQVPEIADLTESNYGLIEVSPRKNLHNTNVRLLNPTLPPKIENKVRLSLLTCDLCGHTTSTINLMQHHMMLHIRNEKLFKCETCNKRFSNKKVLENHKSIHKSSDERKKFECKDCGKFLSSQTAVNNHVKWFHTDRQFKCESCNKKFATVRRNNY